MYNKWCGEFANFWLLCVKRGTMFDIGEKIIYGENGVCTVEKIAPVHPKTSYITT